MVLSKMSWMEENGGGPQLNIRAPIVIWSPGKLDIYTGRNNIGCCFPFNNGINQCTDGRR